VGVVVAAVAVLGVVVVVLVAVGTGLVAGVVVAWKQAY
jgi:hypothetical protein